MTLTDYAYMDSRYRNRSMEKTNLGYEQKSKFIVGPWSVNQNGFYVLTDLKREYHGSCILQY